MFRFLAWLFGLILLLPLGLAALTVAALEDQPLVTQEASLDPGAIARAKALIRKNDPRKLARDETRQVRLGAGDLELLLKHAASRGLRGNARLELQPSGALVHYTALLNGSPVGRYLNVSTELGVVNGKLAAESLRIGRVPLPPAVLELALDAYLRHTDMAEPAELLKKSISRIAITPADVQFTYTWQPEILDTARSLALGADDKARLALAQKRLSARMDALPQGDAPLAAVLGPLLAEAGDKGATPHQRSLAYKDILLVTAVHLGGHNLSALIPEARQWPRPRPRTLTLRGREDLAQHFTISAALAAWSGEPLANAIGLDKELADAQGGSGFSFVDLAADRSGTRLGELARNNPERLAAAVAAGLSDKALLPAIDGLPENMQDAEFQRRFGGVGAPAYKAMADEIERRISALALFR